MSNSEGHINKITTALSFLAGTLAGATAVLLLAPRARRESAERLKGLSDDMRERVSTTLDSAKTRASAIVSRGRDFLDEKLSVIESAVDAGSEAYAQGRARAERPLTTPENARVG